MMLSSGVMRPAMVHTLVDSFFESKKCEVKCLLRDQIDRVVDDLFGELVTTVKELLIPQEVTRTPSGQSEQPSTFSSSQPQVRKSAAPVYATKSMLPPAMSVGKRPRTNSTTSNKSNSKSNQPKKRARTDSCLASLKTNADDGNEESKAKTSNLPNKFPCLSCAKSFPSAYKLKRHDRALHSTVKPFLCKWSNCTYASADRANVINHIRNNHHQLKKQENQNNDEQQPDDHKHWDPGEYVEVVAELLNN